MKQHINEEEVLDEVVELVNECIEYEFESFDYYDFKKRLNRDYIIVKRETATE